MIELCPACTRRPIEDERSGFCDQCSNERVVESYIEKQREAVDKRRARWRAASDQPDATRERQRASRLSRAVRPREPADSATDPWQLAFDALSHLQKVHGVTPATRWHLKEAAELVKQLATGPADDFPSP
jgi:hypothetical protein